MRRQPLDAETLAGGLTSSVLGPSTWIVMVRKSDKLNVIWPFSKALSTKRDAGPLF